MFGDQATHAVRALSAAGLEAEMLTQGPNGHLAVAQGLLDLSVAYRVADTDVHDRYQPPVAPWAPLGDP
jgi:hypothetical protein